MSRDTPLDQAHRAMIDPMASDADHRRYYVRLVAAELFVLLEEDASDTFKPQLIEDEGQRFALAFDREDRLAAFLDEPQDYIALTGRALIAALIEADLGLGINLGMEAATMLPPDVLNWIHDQVAPEVAVEDALVDEIRAPVSAGRDVVEVLSERLPILGGLADHALLVETVRDGAPSLLLGIVDVEASARAACAGAVAEALRLTRISVPLDSIFIMTGAPVHTKMERLGLRFDIPAAPGATLVPVAPGMDPDKPPRLN